MRKLIFLTCLICSGCMFNTFENCTFPQAKEDNSIDLEEANFRLT